MVERRPVPPPRTGRLADPGWVATGGDADPLIDQIFPNRARPVDPSPVKSSRRHRHRRGDKPARGTFADIVNRPIRRRRVLLGLSTGVAVAGGAGAAAAVLTGALGGPALGSGGTRPRTADGLGAAGLADSPSAAAAIAATATPAWPTPLSRDPAMHLLRRATFGATLIDVVAIEQLGVDAWLERQLDPAGIADPAGDGVVTLYPTLTMSTAQLHEAVKPNDYPAMSELGQATIGRQMWSNRQLYEVMVDFWANHFNITNPFDGGWDTRSVFDKDAIRPYALGKFRDMLTATARAPAMLRYLNNDLSDKKAVNENYGRELLELHTVAIDSGYTETDVRNSAYLMTGRTVEQRGVPVQREEALDRRGQDPGLHARQRERRRWRGRRRAVPGIPGDASGHREPSGSQARRPVRLRRPAPGAHRPAGKVLSGQWHRDRPGAPHAVPVPGVLDRHGAEDPPSAGERGRHRPGTRRDARYQADGRPGQPALHGQPAR